MVLWPQKWCAKSLRIHTTGNSSFAYSSNDVVRSIWHNLMDDCCNKFISSVARHTMTNGLFSEDSLREILREYFFRNGRYYSVFDFM